MECNTIEGTVYRDAGEWTCNKDVVPPRWDGPGCIPFLQENITETQMQSTTAAPQQLESAGSESFCIGCEPEEEFPVEYVVIAVVCVLVFGSCGMIYWVFYRHMRAVTKKLKSESKKKRSGFKKAGATGKTGSVNLEDILADMGGMDDTDYEAEEFKDNEERMDWKAQLAEGKKATAEQKAAEKEQKKHNRGRRMSFRDKQKYGLHGIQKEHQEQKGAPMRSIC